MWAAGAGQLPVWSRVFVTQLGTRNNPEMEASLNFDKIVWKDAEVWEPIIQIHGYLLLTLREVSLV